MSKNDQHDIPPLTLERAAQILSVRQPSEPLLTTLSEALHLLSPQIELAVLFSPPKARSLAFLWKVGRGIEVYILASGPTRPGSPQVEISGTGGEQFVAASVEAAIREVNQRLDHITAGARETERGEASIEKLESASGGHAKDVLDYNAIRRDAARGRPREDHSARGRPTAPASGSERETPITIVEAGNRTLEVQPSGTAQDIALRDRAVPVTDCLVEGFSAGVWTVRRRDADQRRGTGVYRFRTTDGDNNDSRLRLAFATRSAVSLEIQEVLLANNDRLASNLKEVTLSVNAKEQLELLCQLAFPDSGHAE